MLLSEEMLKRIVHPCDAWADGAGQDNWRSAVEVMRAGKLLCGPAPRVGLRSALGVTMFFEQVRAEGLHAYVTDIGQAFVGLETSFSPEMIARQQREAETFRAFNPLRSA